MGDERSDIQGLYIKESMHMRSVDELYTQRNKFISDYEIPHLYVDREATWLKDQPILMTRVTLIG